MTSGIWHCRFDGEQSGPFSNDELEYLVRRGRLNRDTEMRREGTQTWIPAEDVPGLFPDRPTGAVQPTKPAAEAPPETPAPASPPIANDGPPIDRGIPADAAFPKPAASETPETPVAPTANPPELPETAPPPIPKNDPPIGRYILTGAAAFLVLLLLVALLFWHGNGGKGHANRPERNPTPPRARSKSDPNERPPTVSIPKSPSKIGSS